jgi:hypothetical protein
MSTVSSYMASGEIGPDDKNDSFPETFSTPARRESLGKRVTAVILPLKHDSATTLASFAKSPAQPLPGRPTR